MDQLVSSDWPTLTVFYAFDAATGETRERMLQSRAIRETVRAAVKECGAELFEFDRAQVGASSDWLCQKVCLPIQNAVLVIADISSYNNSDRYRSNPNVTFEAGMAWGFRKNLMLINASDGHVVADFSGIEHFRYPEDFDSERFQKNLRKFVAENRFSQGFKLISSKVEKVRLLHDVETVGGDWFLASDYPSFLFRPLAALKQLAERNAGDAQEIRERSTIIERRWHGFRSMMDNSSCSFLHLYELEGFEDYFRRGFGRRTSPDMVPTSPDERSEELDQMSEMLKRHYPKLQFAFTANPVPYAYLLRPGSCVYIDSKSDLDHTLNGIFCTYRTVLADLESDFRRQWTRISPSRKTLKATLNVIEKTRSLIKK